MSWLRLCFVLTLVVLLPLRGAVAAAMLCPPAMAAQATTVQGEAPAHAAHAHPHEDHHDHGAMHGDGHAVHANLQAPHDQHAEASNHGASRSVQDGKCNLCAASCSLSTLLGEAPFIPEPPATTATAFPALSAPAPSFLSTGQERPPRST
ncbi:MAG TPA: hypothetical protein H9903_00750 [Candidatus Aquabacterium excrementipullorum]|nr:hypothetical protein [Candidatus Aquabacterium excrementipullorum]